MTLPAWTGRLMYRIAYPGIRLFVWRSHRSYVLISCDNRLLLTQNWMGLQQVWRLPGGGVHRSESATQASVREVREELGIVVPPEQLRLLTQAPVASQRGGYTYDILLWQPTVAPVIQTNSHEIYKAQWFSAAHLPVQLSEHVQLAIELMSRP